MVDRIRAAPIREVPEHEHSLANLLNVHQGKIKPTFDTLEAGNTLTLYLVGNIAPKLSIVWGCCLPNGGR